MSDAHASNVPDWFQCCIAGLATADTVEATLSELIDAAAEAGFDSVGCGETNMAKSQNAAFEISTWPAACLEYCRRKRLHECDPIIRRLQEEPGAIT